MDNHFSHVAGAFRGIHVYNYIMYQWYGNSSFSLVEFGHVVITGELSILDETLHFGVVIYRKKEKEIYLFLKNKFPQIL